MTEAFDKSRLMDTMVPSRVKTDRIMPLMCTCGMELQVHVQGLPMTVSVAEWQASLKPADRQAFHEEHVRDECKSVISARATTTKITRP